jgi:rhodanese-related sulfurtransferase
MTMKTLSRDEVRQKSDEATVVEVLSEDEFSNFHLPGAINVPLGQNFEQRIQAAVPNKAQPVIVYCMDTECNASEQAAEKLDQLGYEQVYDYEAGKLDWKQAGLPVES